MSLDYAHVSGEASKSSDEPFVEGDLYEVSGVHIEPIALYTGNGIFKGVYIESRQTSQDGSNVTSLRIGEEHAKLFRPSKTLIVHGSHPEKISPDELTDKSKFTRKIVRLVADYYLRNPLDQVKDGYLSKESLKFKAGQLALINAMLESNSSEIGPDGSASF